MSQSLESATGVYRLSTSVIGDRASHGYVALIFNIISG